MILLECWKERESIKAHECELSSMGSLQESQRCRLCGEETEAENDIFGTSLQVDLRSYREVLGQKYFERLGNARSLQSLPLSRSLG